MIVWMKGGEKMNEQKKIDYHERCCSGSWS